MRYVVSVKKFGGSVVQCKKEKGSFIANFETETQIRHPKFWTMSWGGETAHLSSHVVDRPKRIVSLCGHTDNLPAVR